jgi:NodT family efflux transporter outer membrane factor (OMF) lipoprotein
MLCVFLITLATLAGCNVGPDYHAPATAMPAAWGEARGTAQPARLAAWWKAFHDPAMDRLIARTVEGNLDLRQAQERLTQARAQRKIVAAQQWPQVAVNGSYNRQRFSVNGLGGSAALGGAGGGGGAAAFTTAGENLYQAGFDATWELDVFGKIRRSVESADASVAAANEDLRNTLVTLLAESALNYVQLRGFQRQLQVAQDNLKAQRETLDLTQVRFKAGAASDLDVSQAQAQVDTTLAQIPPLETSIRQTMHLLGVLSGRDPMAFAELADRASPIPAGPPDVPAGLPADLLRRRPDIRRSERQLAAANAQIGVAVADLFPQFSLTAGAGLQSVDIGNFIDHGSVFWNVGPAMTWTIFDGGAIRANIELKTSQQRQAAIVYRQTVLTALQEVEDALVAFAKEKVHRQALAAAAQSNQRSLDLSMQLYRNGRTDFLSVLDAERALYAAQTSLAQSDSTLSTDLVTIYKALGGGWE